MSKIEVLIFPVFDKIKEAKRSSVQISKTNKQTKKAKGCFIAEKFQIINMGEAVKLYQYFKNLF